MAQLTIKSQSLAKRSDICHQADSFDPLTSSCSRCAALLATSIAVNSNPDSPEWGPYPAEVWFWPVSALIQLVAITGGVVWGQRWAQQELAAIQNACGTGMGLIWMTILVGSVIGFSCFGLIAVGWFKLILVLQKRGGTKASLLRESSPKPKLKSVQ